MTEEHFGSLTIDKENRKIWFNSAEYGRCLLRVQNIPKAAIEAGMIDLRMCDCERNKPK